jgi:hypothetical protein
MGLAIIKMSEYIDAKVRMREQLKSMELFRMPTANPMNDKSRDQLNTLLEEIRMAKEKKSWT